MDANLLILDNLFEDSDSEAEFEGFDVVHGEQPPMREHFIDVERPENDVDNRQDLEAGWKSQTTAPLLLEFDGDSGILANIPATKLPIDYYSVFFPDELYAIIVTETNRYARYV